MGNDYARATSQPRTVTLDGRDYRVSKLSPAIVGEIEAWLRERAPNPRAEAKAYMEGLPVEVQKHIWSEACIEAKSWPPSMDDDEGKRLLYLTAEGQARLLFAFLRRHAADFTLEKARDLAERVDQGDIGRVIEASSTEEIGDLRDPKAPTGAAETP